MPKFIMAKVRKEKYSANLEMWEMNDNVPNRLRVGGINLSSWLHLSHSQIIRASGCIFRQPTLKKKNFTVSVSLLHFPFFVSSSVSNAYLAARIHVFKIWYWKLRKLTHYTVFSGHFQWRYQNVTGVKFWIRRAWCSKSKSFKQSSSISVSKEIGT